MDTTKEVWGRLPKSIIEPQYPPILNSSANNKRNVSYEHLNFLIINTEPPPSHRKLRWTPIRRRFHPMWASWRDHRLSCNIPLPSSSASFWIGFWGLRWDLPLGYTVYGRLGIVISSGRCFAIPSLLTGREALWRIIFIKSVQWLHKD